MEDAEANTIQEQLVNGEDNDEQLEKQEVRSIVYGVLDAVLEYRKELSSTITSSSQNMNQTFGQLVEQGRNLNTALQSWLDTDSQSLLPNELRVSLSPSGNPSGWPLDARVKLKHRLRQILAEYHFVHTIEQIASLNKNLNID
jgi:hypothetical protein